MLKSAYKPPGEPGLWHDFLAQLERTLAHVNAHPATVEYLTHPRRTVALTVPVQLDDGTVSFFSGYRVVHNIALGPARGGVRYHPRVSLGQSVGLAAIATIQSAVFRLPYGGAAGGVSVNPRKLSIGEVERLTRRYAAELVDVIGPDKDILGPDLGTGEREMAWMMDTFSTNRGFTEPGVVTGKPPQLGGVSKRGEAVGRGVLYAVEAFTRFQEQDLAGSTVAVQGYGKVGRAVARLFSEAGAKVIAVSDEWGAVYNPDGLDYKALLAHFKETGRVEGFSGAHTIGRDALVGLDADFLILAALEGLINEGNVDQVRARVIVESAVGAVTADADAQLRRRGVPVVPDVIAGGGGLTMDYLEWVQNFSMFNWSEDRVWSAMQRRVAQTLEEVCTYAEAHAIDLRLASYAIAVDQINFSTHMRGVYP
ncbi:Glu/Leu/Phe/Val family dehydrogenase [Oceanithermus profundus]|uniref:Glutamate dehydrogenase n=1 Tax=Oceanithermus profundus (strain DSM 14977 / NBRC 100410 / VKM B-2274 / 506) TaxID=670487 RepID=E4U4Q3_OCEP5|nr:Glu/Leu/Phe/Val dehydrogenase [Oceanithermus profundus]ADR37120.1 glutamate dehydrogenase (NADP) [Oceanithermus profundus DSM 14977]